MQKYFYKTLIYIVFIMHTVGLSAYANTTEKKGGKQEKILVVATFSILEDMALEIGGDNVQVVSLIARKADAHTFEPSPLTVKKVANAKLLISNGLGFETWLDRLLQSSSFKGEHVVASTGVKALSFNHDSHDNHNDHHNHAHHGLDPHAWQSIANGILYVQNIANAMAKVDAENKDYYLDRAHAYIEKLANADMQIKEKINSIKPENRNAVTGHDAFAYFAKAYDVNFMSAAGISTQAEPSALEIAKLIQMSSDLAKVGFFVEYGTNPRMIKQMAKEIKVTVGDYLYSDTLDDVSHSAGSYMGMMLWNAEQLSKTLQ